MASERDREIWDDATNAVCQAMQEQKMCNCPDGDCLAAKIDFSPEKIATATPVAPVSPDATGKCGELEIDIEATAENIARHMSNYKNSGRLHGPTYEVAKAAAITALTCALGDTRSQAVELLADAQTKSNYWAGQCGELYSKVETLKADNAALTARVKELEADRNEAIRRGEDQWAGWVKEEALRKALEAKLAAAHEALEPFANEADGRKSKTVAGSVCFSQHYLLAARAALGGKPS